uniref:NADH dehydrogenase subunit 2 n=1 Tax=Macropsis hainanensis TaxID=3035245 RepID=UPI002410EBCC|nr:NADH dehydrogenase subunit 2 [Macropsis hainanensis]WEP24706.1 NADH dehydrogenase subunit 2 [Macropsis hainanensis]
MNLNFSKMMFTNTIMIGVMMAVSSNNWMILWTSMEIGVLSIVPLMTQEKVSSDSAIKYFIIQSISSCMMIAMISSMTSVINFKIMLTQAMLIKIGAAPFHMWVLSIIEGIEYYTMFILFTLIKIPGLLTLGILNEQLKYWSILSMIIGSIMVMNQSSLKKMLSYSSIYNVGIMLSSINENQVWMTYLLVYSMMLMMVLILLSKMKMNYLNQLISNEIKMISKTSIWIVLLSMAGMPPMVGFTIKMMILESMIIKMEILLLSIVFFTSILMMFMYMRISFLSMMMFSTLMKWKIFKKSNIETKFLIMNLFFTPLALTLKSLN